MSVIIDNLIDNDCFGSIDRISNEFGIWFLFVLVSYDEHVRVLDCLPKTPSVAQIFFRVKLLFIENE